jgi:hypothetical protein
LTAVWPGVTEISICLVKPPGLDILAKLISKTYFVKLVGGCGGNVGFAGPSGVPG